MCKKNLEEQKKTELGEKKVVEKSTEEQKKWSLGKKNRRKKHGITKKIGELELEIEIPTWNSNWDFEQLGIPTGILSNLLLNLRPGGRVLILLLNLLLILLIIIITGREGGPKNQKTKQFFLSFFLFLFLSFSSFPFLSFPSFLFFFKFQLYFNIQ